MERSNSDEAVAAKERIMEETRKAVAAARKRAPSRLHIVFRPGSTEHIGRVWQITNSGTIPFADWRAKKAFEDDQSSALVTIEEEFDPAYLVDQLGTMIERVEAAA